jgi:hypothetical protein
LSQEYALTSLCVSFLQLAAVSKERDKPMKDQSMLTKQETRNADDISLKVGQFEYIHYVGGFYSYLLFEENF